MKSLDPAAFEKIDLTVLLPACMSDPGRSPP
jgi:hypothetical protein